MTIDAKTGEIVNSPLVKGDEDMCKWTTKMCDDADNLKDFTLCKKKFPLAATVDDGACYYGTVAKDVTKACTWDLCSKDDTTLANDNCKKNKAEFEKGDTKAAADCAFNGTCTWDVCQKSDTSKKWANCSSECLKDPTKAGCFDPKVLNDNCLFGNKCTYDICKDHDVEKATDDADKPKKPTKVSDWDSYYWGQRCTWKQTQNLRLTVPNDTRAAWTHATKRDSDALTAAKA